MNKLIPLALALALTLSLATPSLAATWDIDVGHSQVGFVVRHLVVAKVRGDFNEWSGTVVLDEKDITKSSVNVTIKAASVDSGSTARDKDLRSEMFLDVAKFPEITFKSTAVKVVAPNRFQVTGAFTMHGVTKTIILPVEYLGEAKDPWGNTKAGYAAETVINRKDYGIVWNKSLDTGGTLLGEEVEIAINLEVGKAKPAEAKPAK